jgi:general secretion pathway protein F
MPQYSYKGYDIITGATQKGKIEADSSKGARQKLKQRHKIIVSHLKEEKAGEKNKDSFSFLPQKVSKAELAIMTRQFATLMNAHVPLDEALRALTSQVESAMLSTTMAAVKDSVSEGKSLYDALNAYPNIFTKLYVNMVRAGESSGNLGVVLERLADFLEYQMETRGRIVAAMTYPSVMILAALAIVAFLFVNVVPKLKKVFESLKVDLPWYSKLLIKTSEQMQTYWWLIALVVIGTILGFKYWVGTKEGKEKFDRYAINAPLFGQIILRLNISQFTRTLSTLLNSGVHLVQSLEITKAIISNTQISGVIEDAKIAVQEGKPLGQTIEKSGKFPGLVTHMISTGEATGELENMLTHVANAYESEVQRKITAMVSLIEPIMIVLLFGVAIVVVAGLMLPMLSVMNQIRT